MLSHLFRRTTLLPKCTHLWSTQKYTCPRRVDPPYYKVVNKYENSLESKFKDGLNILKEEFNNDPSSNYPHDGFHFTTIENIFKYIDNAAYIREVFLPDNKDLKMIKNGNRWRSNMMILGNKYELADIDTLKELVNRGADIHAEPAYSEGYYSNALLWASHGGYLDIVKYLVGIGFDVCFPNNAALKFAAENGHFEIVKYLVENDSRVCANNEWALGLASLNGHFEIVKYLVEHRNGDCKMTSDDCNWFVAKYLIDVRDERTMHHKRHLLYKDSHNGALIAASHGGHLDIVKYLVEMGEDIHAENEYALRLAARYGHFDILKFLTEKGADIHIVCGGESTLDLACTYGHFDIVKYLVERGAKIYCNYTIDVTSNGGYSEIVEYLKEKNRDQPPSLFNPYRFNQK